MRVEAVKRIRKELGLPVALLADTKGPEIRIGKFAEPKVELKAGQSFTLTTRDVQGTSEIVSISFAGLPSDVSRGTHILIDDGLIDMVVVSATQTDIVCTVINGGFISANKGINVPGVQLSMPFISSRDRADPALCGGKRFRFRRRLLHADGGRHQLGQRGACAAGQPGHAHHRQD